jgi:hypothetical protein
MIVLVGSVRSASTAFRIIGVIKAQKGIHLYSIGLVAIQIAADTPGQFGLANLFQVVFIPLCLAQKAVEARRMTGRKQSPVKTGYVLAAIIDNEGDKQSRQMTLGWFSQAFSEKG